MKLLMSRLVFLILVTTCYASYGRRRLKASWCPQSGLLPNPHSQCCGVDSLGSNRIVGGQEAKLRQYPWLALIEYRSIKNNNVQTRCGGSLISGRYVLTAAHCVAGNVTLQSYPVSVRLGEHDRTNRGPDCVRGENGKRDCTNGPIRIPIEEIITYKRYAHHTRDDIALIRLARVAPYTDEIRPICLPLSDVTRHHAHNDTWFWAAGWGYQGPRGGGLSTAVKRHVALPFRPMEECKSLWGSVVNKKHICAGGQEGQSICKGDSGGPLMYERRGVYEAVGISSFIPGRVECGQSTLPGVFTKVYEYMKWIQLNIRP